jgi:hypothetical protein
VPAVRGQQSRSRSVRVTEVASRSRGVVLCEAESVARRSRLLTGACCAGAAEQEQKRKSVASSRAVVLCGGAGECRKQHSGVVLCEAESVASRLTGACCAGATQSEQKRKSH